MNEPLMEIGEVLTGLNIVGVTKTIRLNKQMIHTLAALPGVSAETTQL